MLLHELSDNLILLNELGLEPRNQLGLKLLGTRWPSSRALQSMFSLVEHLLDPGVDLAGLDTELISEVGNWFLTSVRWRRTI